MRYRYQSRRVSVSASTLTSNVNNYVHLLIFDKQSMLSFFMSNEKIIYSVWALRNKIYLKMLTNQSLMYLKNIVFSICVINVSKKREKNTDLLSVVQPD